MCRRDQTSALAPHVGLGPSTGLTTRSMLAISKRPVQQYSEPGGAHALTHVYTCGRTGCHTIIMWTRNTPCPVQARQARHTSSRCKPRWAERPQIHTLCSSVADQLRQRFASRRCVQDAPAAVAGALRRGSSVR